MMKQFPKTTFIFTLSIFFLLFSACENEPIDSGIINNGGNSSNTGQIIGDWNVTSFNATTATTTSVNGEEFEVSSIITGSEFDYFITFTSDAFSTNGNYQMRAITEANGVLMDDFTTSYTNVNGNGSYSTNGNLITTEGILFDLEIEGVDTSVFETNQTATYQFSSNGNVLTLTQSEEHTEVFNGIEIFVLTEANTVLERI